MKKKIIIALSTVALLFLFLRAVNSEYQVPPRGEIKSVQTVRPAPELASLKEARDIILNMMQEENIIGLSVSISIDDTLVWSEGLGSRDMEGLQAVSPDQTQFRIASLSKPFTATILGRLTEEEKVNPDASLYDYVPEFPKKKYDFTLKQLAMHRAGIRHYNWLEGENKKNLTVEEGLDKFKKSRLRFEPGTEYLYSSYGYNLLGFALEKASGKSFESLLSEYITQPLNLEHTAADKAVYDELNISGFFTSNGKGRIKTAEDVNMYMKLPSGGMLSTSEDLVRFGNAYSYGRILTAQTREEILNELPLPDGSKTGYGMGWGVSRDKKGRKIISHTGGNTGSVCRLIVYPEAKLTIAVVSNTFGIDFLKFLRNLSKISNSILTEINR